MHRFLPAILCSILIITACSTDNPTDPSKDLPIVNAVSTYNVTVDEDIIYADGLSLVAGSKVEMPQLLDLYYPDNTATNRPVYLFIHGGGFQGGTKTKPEIIDMAHYFASRGWVFASVDYRTTSDLDGSEFTGIAPQAWIDFTLQNAETPDQARTSIAMYAAQRDVKAALRWMVANADTYNMDTAYITVGGASAGAISTIALGISDQADFRDEVSATDDPTLASTNLDQTYEVSTMVDFWGSNVKLDLLQSVYGVDRYDSNDPDLFIAHGTDDPTVLFSEGEELDSIYTALGILHQFVPLVDKGHGAWTATVDGKGLSEMTFDFIVESQNLSVE